MPPHHPLAPFGALVARLFYPLERARPPPPPPRPARFLGKAPLFTAPKVGWLVRASGAIPVHRRQDAASDEAGQARAAANDDTFRAAESALLAGDAIALFPEG